MSPSNSDHVDVRHMEQLFANLDGSNAGATWHAMPALFKGVSNAHPLILTVHDLRWHLWRIFGLGAASLSLAAMDFSAMGFRAKTICSTAGFRAVPNPAHCWASGVSTTGLGGL